MSSLRILFVVVLLAGMSRPLLAQPQAIQIYRQDELLELIKINKHLRRVLDDDCQLVQDIEARAEKMKVPAYEFLWGDMLAHGICVEEDIPQGLVYIERAADQGLPEALEQLGRYYATGKWVQANLTKAMKLLRPAAEAGNLKALLRFGDLVLAGHGMAMDREDAYRWLKSAVIPHKPSWRRADDLAKKLAKGLPPSVVSRIDSEL
ncbi:tetratricopeptide repeat protein [Gallaecimonas sp. GXIMD4217]|uniref:tetratricopeptide repeat protein n=1 Tax=Gallaecimonas sp. GXIMD4217 TaxID=3131927 RepID=UPI00311B192E